MDSKMDLDVGKPAQPHGLSPTSDPQSISTLDGWIESLFNLKQLAESDIARLCDRAREVLQDESNVQPVVSSSSPSPCYLLITLRNARLLSAVTSMVNSMTSLSYFASVETALTQTTFSWVTSDFCSPDWPSLTFDQATMSIAAITLSKPLPFLFA